MSLDLQHYELLFTVFSFIGSTTSSHNRLQLLIIVVGCGLTLTNIEERLVEARGFNWLESPYYDSPRHTTAAFDCLDIFGCVCGCHIPCAYNPDLCQSDIISSSVPLCQRRNYACFQIYFLKACML